jgi:tetratricopeptide (TPR) repeat protein
MGGEVQQFVFAAERALALLEKSPHREALQLHLFNAYLSLEEYERAASTLYQTFMIDGFLIQQENQLWLAHYYLEKEQEKSVEIFRKILGVDESGRVCFDPDQTHFEKEALALAGLVSVSEREPLLTSLVEIQRGNTQLSWKNQDKALFELAKTLVELNQPEKALELLEELTAFSAPNSVLHAALLEKSRLLLSQCKKETDNSTLQLVLSTLKDLQIQKDLGGEPVHLEAAFDYADLRVALAAAESQTEVALFFLNRMKEDFSDLQYQEARLRFPEKDELFQVYMQCLEAEILCWESKEALEVGDKQQAEHKAQVAAALFEAVAQNEGSTKYLKSRVEEKLKNL